MRTLILFLSIWAIHLTGQSTLTGTIIDDQGQPVFYANVVLYASQDSSLIKGVVSEMDGTFALSEIEPGNYYVEATMLSYQTVRTENLSIPGDDSKPINLTLLPDSELLKTVEIVGKRPLLEQKADRMIVNVADNVTSLNANLLDVMKKVPGVLVTNGRISMAGQSNVRILIDGRSTDYIDVQALLKDMPGENIKKVEIIHQPGAEFEAEGSGPIINIILKKNNLYGTKGTVSMGIGKGKNWQRNAGINLSHKHGALDIQGNLNYNHNSWYEELAITRKVGGATFDQVTRDPVDPLSLSGGLSIDYRPSDAHRMGISTQVINSNTTKTATNETNIDGLTTRQSILTDNVADRSWDLMSINPYYKYQLDTVGSEVSLDFNLLKFGRENMNTLFLEGNSEQTDLQDQLIQQIGDNQLWATKLDIKKVVNDQVTLNIGGKYADAKLDNDLQSFDEIDNVWNKNVNQSNQFLFSEKITAAYGKVNYTYGAWTGTVGLRYEDSRSVGTSVTIDSTLSRTIKKLFPSFSLNRSLVAGLGANVAYSYRIDRPNYSSLNPFVYYYDPYTYEQGNPSLRPELTHSAKFSLSMEGQPFFNVEYKRSNDAIVEVTEQNDVSGETSRLSINLGSRSNFNTSLFLPVDVIPGINGGYAGVMVNRTSFDAQYLGEAFDPTQWNVTAFTQLNFDVPGGIKAEVNGFYSSANREGIITSEWIYGVGMGFSKKVLDDKGRISVGVDDLFNRFFHGNINYANMDADILSKWDTKVVNVQFSYTFGNQGIKAAKKNEGSARDEARRIDFSN